MASAEIRRHNLSAVLDRLHIEGALSRSQLAARTGLNRSTIGDLIAELEDLGLVVEGGKTPVRGPGRPSSVASPRAASAVVLAVDLEVDSTTVATVGLGGHIFDRVRADNSPQTPNETVENVGKLATPLLAALPDRTAVVGAGVAVAGVVRREDGFVHISPNLGWTNIPLGDMISSRLDLPVSMANEADMGALAEYRRGGDGGAEHLIFVSGEVGVGVGIIQGGEPMLGAAGFAGEAGHMVVNPEGRQCRCGATGCWETEVGEESLARRAGMPPDQSGPHLLAEVMRRAAADDRRTLEAFEELGRWLGVGIGNLINIFNPKRVVIGGFFHDLYPHLERSLTDSARGVALPAPWHACSIQNSHLGTDAPLLGAAELVFGDLISNPTGLTATGGPRPRNSNLVG